MRSMPDQAESRLPEAIAPRWGRSLLLSAMLVLGLAALAWGWRHSSSKPAYASGPGRYLVSMDDYAFAPSQMSWRVGETVSLTFENRSSGHPGHPHEFMLGRSNVTENTPFGPMPGDGYKTDFFSNVDVRLSHEQKVTMVMPGNSIVSGRMPPMTDMGSMAMENGFMVVLAPGGTVTVTFRVPNKHGRWQYGCFQQSGQHYLNGMKGWVTIVA